MYPNITLPVSILYKSIAGRYRPVRVADGPITARYIFIKNASWGITLYYVHAIFAANFHNLAVLKPYFKLFDNLINVAEEKQNLP